MIFVLVLAGMQVRLEARVLVPERVHVDDHVLHGLEVRHRIDLDRVVLAQDRREIGVLHASPVTPLMFIEHEPQIADRHERRNEIEPSTSAFAYSSASSTVDVSVEVDVDALAVRFVVVAGSKRKRSSVIFRHAVSSFSLPACIW